MCLKIYISGVLHLLFSPFVNVNFTPLMILLCCCSDFKNNKKENIRKGGQTSVLIVVCKS